MKARSFKRFCERWYGVPRQKKAVPRVSTHLTTPCHIQRQPLQPPRGQPQRQGEQRSHHLLKEGPGVA